MDRYRGGPQVPKGVKVNQHDYGGVGENESHYNSKTLTNQYIIKNMESGPQGVSNLTKMANRMLAEQ